MKVGKYFISKVQYESIISVILKLCMFLIILKYGFEFLRYTKHLLTSWQFVEPAENENLVLSWAYRMYPGINLQDLISRGIFPIYPDLYHRIVAILPFGLQFGGRLLSVFSAVGTMGVFALWIRKRTGSYIISVFFGILSFGIISHAIYFMMQRADGLAIFLGFTSFLGMWWNYDLDMSIEENYHHIPLWRYILSAVLAALANLTKQTYIIFLPIFFLPSILFLFKKDYNLSKKFIWAGIAVIIVTVGYGFFINNDVYTSYYYGLTMFAKNISLSSLYSHFQVGFRPNYLIILGLAFFFILRSLSFSDKGLIGVILFISILTMCVVYRLWGNIAAYYNNFIFVSTFPIFIIFLFWEKITKYEKEFVLLIMLIVSFQTIGLGPSNTFKKYATALEVGINDQTVVEEFINNHPGIYISDRLDNYLIQSNVSVSYESSVMTSLLKAMTIKEVPFQTELINVKNRVRDKIIKQEYQGIILGIQTQLFLEVFPEVIDYYSVEIIQTITTGQFTYDLSLFTPTEIQIYGN